MEPHSVCSSEIQARSVVAFLQERLRLCKQTLDRSLVALLQEILRHANRHKTKARSVVALQQDILGHVSPVLGTFWYLPRAKNLNHDKWPDGREFSMRPQEYELGELSTQLQCQLAGLAPFLVKVACPLFRNCISDPLLPFPVCYILLQSRQIKGHTAYLLLPTRAYKLFHIEIMYLP